MQTRTIEIGKLFLALEKLEKIEFINDQEIFLNTPVHIQDHKGEFVPIVAGITKECSGISLRLSNGEEVVCAKKHRVAYDGKNCKFADEFNAGDTITLSDGSQVIVLECIPDDTTRSFYDLMVDTDEHLYQTSNGVIHHNTEVAKQLAHTLGIPLHRFDMSEYMEKHSISKLIGAPPGYVGYDEAGGSGLLTGTVEKQPHCVLLLDEIEKAHPDVFSILLQVMDAGRLTDSGGKTVDFRNVWLIMTSNAGVREGEKSSIGFGSRPQDYNHSGAQEAIKKIFTPEFRNRLDALVPFQSLQVEHIRHIAEKFIDELILKVADRKIKITVQDTAYDWLVANGFDQKYGARLMKRLISDKIKEPLAHMIVMGELDEGGRVTISEKNGSLFLKKTKR